MKSYLKQILITLVYGIFYISVPTLFYQNYQYHLLTISEYQMFMFGWDELILALSFPGGFSGYLGDWVTAYFAIPRVGAIILGILFLLIGFITTFILKKADSKSSLYLFPLVTVLMLAQLHLNMLVKLSSTIMILIILLLSALYVSIKKEKCRWGIGISFVILAYWLGAVGSLILASIIVVWELFRGKEKWKYLYVLCVVVIALLLPLFTRLALATSHPFLMINAYLGDVFTVEKEFSPDRFYMLWSATPLYLVSTFIWNNIFGKGGYKKESSIVFSILFVIQFIVLIILGKQVYSKYIDYQFDETVMKSEYMVKTGQWDELVKMTYTELPLTEYTYPFINLALAKTGKMSTNLLQYPGNAPQAMLIPFMQDYMTAKTLTEIFFNVGDIANAQHMAFEGMISTPGGKNVNLMKRLTECALINGDYVIAKKYLALLSKTPLHKKWADNCLQLMGNEKQFAQVPWIAEKRLLLPKENQILDMDDIVRVCLPLLNANPNNKVAFEYVSAAFLLVKSLDNFVRLYTTFKPNISAKDVPALHQQAFITYYETQKISPEQWNMQYISENTGRQFLKFKQTVMKLQQQRASMNEPTFVKEFGQTYWYFFLIQK